MNKEYYICENCGTKYNLKESYLIYTTRKGKISKVYSSLSYKYCGECLPRFETDPVKAPNIVYPEEDR